MVMAPMDRPAAHRRRPWRPRLLPPGRLQRLTARRLVGGTTPPAWPGAGRGRGTGLPQREELRAEAGGTAHAHVAVVVYQADGAAEDADELEAVPGDGVQHLVEAEGGVDGVGNLFERLQHVNAAQLAPVELAVLLPLAPQLFRHRVEGGGQVLDLVVAVEASRSGEGALRQALGAGGERRNGR